MRSKSNFVKFSGVVIVVLLALATVGNGTNSGQSAKAATMEATMGMAAMSGPFPPCPQVADAAMMQGTMQAGMMAPTMDPGMMVATMAPTMGSAMMSGTMDAMTAMMTNGCHFSATLAGSEEVPAAGAPAGKGTAELSFSAPASGPGQVCYVLQVEGLTLPATAAHIHKGAKGVPGPVVIPFKPAPDAAGAAQGCAQNVDPALMADILTHPSEYYVNVHTTDFPNGAARGQIEEAEMMGAMATPAK